MKEPLWQMCQENRGAYVSGVQDEVGLWGRRSWGNCADSGLNPWARCILERNAENHDYDSEYT